MKPLFVASSYSAENNSSIISIYKQLGSITLIGKGTEEENSLFQPTKSFSNANDILNLKWINNKYLGIVTQSLDFFLYLHFFPLSLYFCNLIYFLRIC